MSFLGDADAVVRWSTQTVMNLIVCFLDKQLKGWIHGDAAVQTHGDRPLRDLRSDSASLSDPARELADPQPAARPGGERRGRVPGALTHAVEKLT